ESVLRIASSRRASPNAATFAGLSAVALVFQARDALDDPDVERLRDGTKRLAALLEPGELGDEALVAQVVERLVVDVEVVLGHDAEGADGGQRAAVLAV
ncbi:MAG: hypothetical protein ACLGHP_12750, partial [Vicinamibacteria bacterium]